MARAKANHPGATMATRGATATVILPATQQAVRATLLEIASGLTGAGCDKGLVASSQLVLAEVMNNVVEHAYGKGEDGDITVLVSVAGDAVLCEIRDRGRPMPLGALPGARFPEVDPGDVHGLPEGGFGWAMVRHLTRNLSYQRIGDANLLRFEVSGGDMARGTGFRHDDGKNT